MWLGRTGYYRELNDASRQSVFDVTPGVRWFTACVEMDCNATVAQVDSVARQNSFWVSLLNRNPQVTTSQRKMLIKFYYAEPAGFEVG